jgi:hypothetical protein
MAIHQEMKAKLKVLPEEKLEKIILYKNDFTKIDFDENEVELNGKMYDIAKVVEYSDHFIIYALHDQSEDSLLSFLDEITKRSSDSKERVPSQLLQFLSLIFIPISNNFNIGREESVFYFADHTDFYQSIEKGIHSPPPWG